jgi:TolB-like protein
MLTTNQTTTNQTTTNNPNNNRKKRSSTVVLPFTNKKADVFAQKLNKLVTTNFPNIDFIVAFKTPNDIGKMFPFKDNIRDVEKQSLVIYRIKCELAMWTT